MREKINAQRGTADVLPNMSYKWRYLEQIFNETATRFGYKEIRTPTFEATELFARGVGDTTDVVQKEMYTFNDKGERSITLKPEGTAGVIRATVENSLLSGALPLKVCYTTPAFRYEKPQAGRLREFHQFGVEILGADSPTSDVRLIDFARCFYDKLKIKNLRLEINSIGCAACRSEYHKALIQYFTEQKQDLCNTCIGRIDKNPMRLLDCKVLKCSEINKNAPLILDYICDECNSHFEQVKSGLDILKIKYTINPKIVRGLDYYVRTVFEFITDEIGAQGTVCGGGRYDGLVKTLGGADVSGLGFAMGVERLLLLMEQTNVEFPQQNPCKLYICNAGENCKIKVLETVSKLNNIGEYCECDETGRGLKAQMKYADKIGAKYTAVIGDDELISGIIRIKNMQTGEVSEKQLNHVEKWKL